MYRGDSGRPTSFSMFAKCAAAVMLATFLVGSLGTAVAAESDKTLKQTRPAELIGPIAPSIHVPPVRRQPPEKTHQIEHPPQYDPATTAHKRTLTYRLQSLRLAIEDLIATFGERYPNGPEYLDRWREIKQACREKSPNAEATFITLRNDALLANPLLDIERLLVLKRKRGQLGLPTNHQCNPSLEQHGYDNELAVLSPVRPSGNLTTLFRPQGNAFVGEMDLRFDAQRVLFTMPNGRTWEIHEIGMDGRGLRQVSREVADVDNFDPCYLPSGAIIFASTASFTGVPCWHGKERACCLFTMKADGSQVRQLCYDQDLDLHPSVLDDGQVIFSRWDYTGLLHAYLRPLMVMNPDGTGQRAVYGSNSYYPNCLFFPRGVPGQPHKIVAVLTGYHGKNRMGELAVLDVGAGWSGAAGIVHRIMHRGEPVVPVMLDRLTQAAEPQFLHPYPLSDKYILVAMKTRSRPWGIYLVDVFDNVVPILTDPQYDFFEPIPVLPRPVPPTIPNRVDTSRDDAVVVMHDIYQGEGLKGVPRGTIKRLRVAAYQFGYPGMAGPDKIGRAGPWEAMRILGTVPVYDDGSAKFRLPANTPVTLQALDADGMAVQLMRSWYTAMPGETASCVGCHETPSDVPRPRLDIAALQEVAEIEPWYGPARGFDFAREVQPVLDRHCVVCHDGQQMPGDQPMIDLRDASQVPNYVGLPLTRLGATRIDRFLLKQFPERFPACKGMPQPYGELRTLYTPAYEALIPFIRRVNIEDGVRLLRPGEYHAATSELIHLLRKGHYGVKLDHESLDRLVTWIDLNGPCHGTWEDVADVPYKANERRPAQALASRAPSTNLSVAIERTRYAQHGSADLAAVASDRRERRKRVEQLLRDNPQLGKTPDVQRTGETISLDRSSLDLGNNLTIDLVHIPKGSFLMGDTAGSGDDDESPVAVVAIERGFWIGRTEVTNAQMRALVPEHSSRFFTKRQIDKNGPGIQLDTADQPAVRVSWVEAMEFCRRLSVRCNRKVTLPSESQWEYAARAGTLTDMSFGDCSTDFSTHANMADRSLACLYEGTAGVAVMQPIPSIMEVDDQAIGTADVASYQPNAWGLYDMHGNAAEWTRSLYRPYPFQQSAQAAALQPNSTSAKRVVRGGSFYDRPKRCRSSHRRAYPAWQGVHDVGFRVLIDAKP